MPRTKRSGSPFEIMDDDFDDTSSQSSRNGNPPIQRNAANARERARMRVLSSAFGRLKTKLPNIPADTKLSKLDTLRLATMYIKQLKSVVEGEVACATTNGENAEGSLTTNNNSNNSTNCYLNLNMGAQSMNWPFGFHHHLSNSPLLRSTSATSLVNNNTSGNNWCARDNNTEEQIKHTFYNTENYEYHHPQQPSSSSSLMNQTCSLMQQSNDQHNHWFSETPSPELDSTTTSTCLNFENRHFQSQPEHHHQAQLLVTSRHHHNHNLPHLQPASAHSSAFQLEHNFHHHTQHHQPLALHHSHQNGFINSSNFQSTSIR